MKKWIRLVSLLLILLGMSSTGFAQGKMAFNAHLTGAQEVPPVDTAAQGQFTAMSMGSNLDYRLIVANLQNIVAAHIHCAPAGSNGSVGVTLFSGSPVTLSGVLASGPILMPDSGNACGWTTVADIVAAMAAANTYINVHTLQSLPGEIRGQVR